MTKKDKPKPTVPGAPWDFGPNVLAVIGDVPVMLASFGDYLRQNPDKRKAVLDGERQATLEDADGDAKRQKRITEQRRAKARQVTADWMRLAGFTLHTEDVSQIDDNGRKVNPNGVRRAVRLSVAETYRRQGHLTKRQAAAAEALLKAWERNLRTAPAIRKVQVDTFPKPDDNIAVMVDRIGAYHRIAKLVPPAQRAFVMHVARDDRFLSAMPGYRDTAYMDRLRTGLDGLADGLGM